MSTQGTQGTQGTLGTLTGGSARGHPGSRCVEHGLGWVAREPCRDHLTLVTWLLLQQLLLGGQGRWQGEHGARTCDRDEGMGMGMGRGKSCKRVSIPAFDKGVGLTTTVDSDHSSDTRGQATVHAGPACSP
jgi:hypothetical protein